MIKYIIYFSFILVFLLTGCDNSQNINTQFTKDKQLQTERTIVSKVVLQDSIHLYNRYDVNSGHILKNDEKFLYVSDRAGNKLSIIDNRSFEKINTITVPEGRGPGEMVNMTNFTIEPPHIYFFSEQLIKIQVWHRNGELLSEFVLENSKPHRMVAWNDGSMTILSPMSPDFEYIFHTKDDEGNLLYSFGAIPEDEFNYIKFSGELINDDKYFYYAGYSEHVLQKWDREGNLYYSIATIEDFPSELNYAVMQSEEQRSVGYLDTGNFSAKGVTLYEDYLIIAHAGVWGDPTTEFLDIYNKHDGRYLASFQIPHTIGYGQIVVDDDRIYTIHSIDDEMHLGVYDNFLKELDSKI
jgi:hypothetical protein